MDSSSQFSIKVDGTPRQLPNIFISELGSVFCLKLVNALPLFFEDKSYHYTYWRNFIKYLEYICNSSSYKDLKQYLHTGTIKNKSHIFVLWSGTLTGYREFLINKNDIQNRTKSNLQDTLTQTLKHLAIHGIVPRNLKITPIPYDRSTIGESFLSAQTALPQSFQGLKDTLDKCEFESGDETELLIRNLLIQNEINSKKENKENKEVNRENLVDLASSLIDERINTLRNYSINIILERLKKLELSSEWSKNPDFLAKAEQLKNTFDIAQEPDNGDRKDRQLHDVQLKEEYKRLLIDNPLEVLTVFCIQYEGGVRPRDKTKYSGQFHTRVTSYSEIKEIDEHLHATMDSIVAAYAMLLLDTTANPTGMIELKTNCMGQKEGDKRELCWIKRRSGSPSPECDFFTIYNPPTLENFNPLNVVDFLLKATKRLRNNVLEKDKDSLFLIKGTGGPTENASKSRRPHINTLGRNFASESSKASDGDWRTVPKAIRTSILLLTAMVEKNVFAVQEKGKHKSLTMGRKYVNHIAENLRREDKIREFLDWYESVLSINISEFDKKVGINSKIYKENVESARLEFGGLLCSNPYESVQEGTEEGKACHRVDKCFECGNRRNFFLATSESFLNAMFLNDALIFGKTRVDDEIYQSKWYLWELFTKKVLTGFGKKIENNQAFNEALKMKSENVNPYLKLFDE